MSTIRVSSRATRMLLALLPSVGAARMRPGGIRCRAASCAPVRFLRPFFLEYAIQERLGPRVSRAAEEFLLAAVLDDPPLLHEDDSRGDISRKLHLVGH